MFEKATATWGIIIVLLAVACSSSPASNTASTSAADKAGVGASCANDQGCAEGPCSNGTCHCIRDQDCAMEEYCSTNPGDGCVIDPEISCHKGNCNSPPRYGEDANEGSSPGSTQGATQGSTQGSAQGSTQGSTQGSAQGATQGATQGSAQGATQGATQGSAQGATQGATQGSAQGATQGSTQGAYQSAAQGQSRSRGGEPRRRVNTWIRLYRWMTHEP